MFLAFYMLTADKKELEGKNVPLKKRRKKRLKSCGCLFSSSPLGGFIKRARKRWSALQPGSHVLPIICGCRRRRLRLPEISFKNVKSHDQRLSSAHQRASLSAERERRAQILAWKEERCSPGSHLSCTGSSCEVLFSIRCIILKTHLTFQGRISPEIPT